MGPNHSDGPMGLDPSRDGTCPGNPKDGKKLGGTADYDHVVSQRIRDLESRVTVAEDRLKQVSPSKTELAGEITALKKELKEKNELLSEINRLIESGMSSEASELIIEDGM